jgi:hypothetical protein
MCEFSGKLIAWFDRELSTDKAADVERHVRICAECWSQLGEYERVSAAFAEYCDAAIASKVRRRPPRWVLAVSSAAAVSAILFLALPHARLWQPPAPIVATVATQSLVLKGERIPAAPVKAPVLVKEGHRRHPVLPLPQQDVTWFPVQPPIQIAIPAEAMFPPGALPEGVSFAADLTIAADGSAQRLRLRP